MDFAKGHRNQCHIPEPLLYVRDRLGHADVQTTAEYLHVINQLEAQLVLQHEDFIDGNPERDSIITAHSAACNDIQQLAA